MAKTLEPDEPRLLADVAADLKHRLVELYKSMALERSILHRMSFDRDVPNAADALYLIETPFDDLAGITGQLAEPIVLDRVLQFQRLLAISPLANRQPLIAWLKNEVGCPHVASFLEGADGLRLLLLRSFNVPQAPIPEKRSA